MSRSNEWTVYLIGPPGKEGMVKILSDHEDQDIQAVIVGYSAALDKIIHIRCPVKLGIPKGYRKDNAYLVSTEDGEPFIPEQKSDATQQDYLEIKSLIKSLNYDDVINWWGGGECKPAFCFEPKEPKRKKNLDGE